MSKMLSGATLFVAVAVLPSMQASAGTLTTLNTFNNTNGAKPLGSLIADSAGNLYGTTSEGGVRGSIGTVFELSPPAAGQPAWTETILTSFTGNGADPTGGLIFDSAGNLYGTTEYGGIPGSGISSGTVFELTPPAPGQTAWTPDHHLCLQRDKWLKAAWKPDLR